MRQLSHAVGGRTAMTEFQAERRTMVKPVIVSEKNGYYYTKDGREFEKKRFDYLFKTTKGKVLKRHAKGENADKSRDWMK